MVLNVPHPRHSEHFCDMTGGHAIFPKTGGEKYMEYNMLFQ